jgi:uncharacterized membrane protein
MGLGRVEAFSDGVIAVILTIMVLELKAPENGDLSALLKLKLPLLNYLLSFVVIGIFWVNHRTILSLVRHVEPAILWWNNALLFWMSLVPFATAYMGQSDASPLSVAVYGGLLAITSSTFGLLRFAIAKQHKADPKMSRRHKQLHFKDAFGQGRWRRRRRTSPGILRISLMKAIHRKRVASCSYLRIGPVLERELLGAAFKPRSYCDRQ